jgi:hypothetical protein
MVEVIGENDRCENRQNGGNGRASRDEAVLLFDRRSVIVDQRYGEKEEQDNRYIPNKDE